MDAANGAPDAAAGAGMAAPTVESVVSGAATGVAAPIDDSAPGTVEGWAFGAGSAPTVGP